MTYLNLRDVLSSYKVVTLGLPGGDLAVDLATLETHAVTEQSSELEQELEGVIAQFLFHLEVNDDLKPLTIDGYRKRLGQFREWLEKNDRSAAQAEAWQLYLKTIKDKKLSPYTKKGHYHILNRFARWLVETGKIYYGHPLEMTRAPRLPKERLYKAIHNDNILKILREAHKDPRDWALFLFFRDTGCRAMEAIQLTWQDFQHIKPHERNHVAAQGKADKERYLFFGVATTQALLAYKKTVPHGPDDPVWWSRTIAGENKAKLTYTGLYRIFRKLARRAGLGDENFSPHAWRHAYGRDMSANGIPTTTLADLMGHGYIEVTQIYTRFNTTELAQAHARYSPVDGDLASLGVSAQDEPER